MSNGSTVNPATAEESVYYHNDESGSKILVRILRSDLGLAVLEVGAGAGFITQELASGRQSVVAIEPNRTLCNQL